MVPLLKQRLADMVDLQPVEVRPLERQGSRPVSRAIGPQAARSSRIPESHTSRFVNTSRRLVSWNISWRPPA